MRRTYFSANVFRIHLVHHVTECAEIVLAVFTVNAIVDGYEADIVLGKVIICVLTYLKVVSTKSRGILNDNGRDISHLHILKHLLKAGAVEVCSRVSVIHIEFGIGEPVLLCILGKKLFLIAKM